jgi:hypothetical protein
MEKLITPDKKNHFYGYYDKSPLNLSKTLLISHEVDSFGRELNKNDTAKICVTNLKNGETKPLATTFAWNYQQGSQLQWISDNKIIFNSYKEDYVAIIFDLKQFKTERILKNPIYSISDDKKIYSSIDYSRIHKFRKGYGYLQKEYQKNDSLLKICSFDTSQTLVELNKEDFKEYSDMDFEKCWIDHILFAPNDHDFVFLFRSLVNNSLVSYLFFYDFKNKKLYNVLNSGMAGHGSWLNNENFIIWAREKQLTKKINQINNSILKKIIKLIRLIGVPKFIRKNIYGDKYIKFNKREKKINKLDLDIPYDIAGGHFSFTKDTNLMISDTYHNHNYQSVLFSYNMNNKSLNKFQKFNCIESIKDKAFRCDLHPRIISNQELIIDSTHEGFRGIYMIKLSF